MKLVKLLLLITFELFIFNSANGQLKASFTATDTTGCGPTPETFTSTSSPTDSIRWFVSIYDLTPNTSTFGFTLPSGVYKVRLIAYNHLDSPTSDTVSKTINIYDLPVADFSVNRPKTCSTDTAIFNDLSTVADGTITGWNWNFGDTTTSISHNPTHIYTSVGNYSVSLKVTDSNKCTSDITAKTNYISIVPKPTAAFDVPPTAACIIPLKVTFIDNSTGPDPVYSWSFGNGTFSNLRTPTATYDSIGNFNVKLVVTSSDYYGCYSSETVPSAVSVTGNVQAKGTISQNGTVINNNGIICKGDINFSNTSTGVTSVLWNFGDDTVSSSNNGVHNYSKSGIYDVLLIVSAGSSCIDTLKWVINVMEPSGSFTPFKTEVCKNKAISTYLSDTSDVVSYRWVLGDGRDSTVNPLLFSYKKPGVDTFRLELFGANGCNAVTTPVIIYVDSLLAGFSISDSVICAQTSIQFTNLSHAGNQQIWDLGDGTTSTMFTPPPHLYLTAGDSTISLYVTSANGCRDSAKHSLLVNPLPDIAININKQFCSNRKLLLIATTNGDSVLWTPGFIRTLTDTVKDLPAAKTSMYKVNVKIAATKCASTDSIKVYIPDVIISPVDTTIVTEGTNKISVILKDSSGIDTFKWTPLTGLSCSKCLNPVITLSNINNTYIYTLVVYDRLGCFTDTAKVNVIINIDTTETYALPKAFRPGSEGVNGVFKILGSGIKQLLEFKIFNRYGNMVFSTTDLSEGWDGTYNGHIQPVDTYIYTVTVQTTDGNISTKKGAVLLLR